MRQLFAYAFVAAMVALLAAPMAAGTSNVAVIGTVTDIESGAPVAGAKVTLSYWIDVVYTDRNGAGASTSSPSDSPAEYTAVSGADGTFSVSVAPGSYGVNVEAAGFERYYGSFDTAYESKITISLTKLPPYDAQLTVSVKDSQTGAGVAGADVYGWPDFTYGGEIGIMGFPSYQQISGTTDVLGKFQCGIWNGAYTLSVSADGYFYGSDSVVVDGADLSYTIELTPVPTPNSTLSGSVVDQSTGAPIAGAEIYVYPDYSYMGANCWGGYASPDAVYTDAAGHYSVAVYGGASSISVSVDGFYSYWGSVNVPDNFAMNFDAALFPIVEPDKVSVLAGKVVDENGGAVVGATVQVTYWPSSYGYDVMRTEGQTGTSNTPSDPGYAMGGGNGYDMVAPPTNGYDGAYYGSQPWYYEAMTDSGGKYSLPVPMGELSVSIWVEGYYPYYGWMSVGYAGSFSLNATLSPVPEPDAAISGAISDATTGEPIEGAYVGAYLVRDPVEMYDMAVGESAAGGMGGVDSASAPAPGIAPDKLSYMDPYGYYYAEAVTDANGKFTIEVPHGDQALSVWAGGYAYYSTTLSLEEGQTLVVELSMTRSSDESAMAGMSSDGSGKQYVMSMSGDMNALPATGGSAKLSIAPGESREIVMSDVFQGGNGLTYSYEAPENLRVSYDEASGTIRVTAPNDWTGKEDITLKATDGTATVYKTMSVSVAPQSSFAVITGFSAAIIIALVVIAAIWKTQKE